MKTNRKKRKADALMVLLRFGVFAVCILSVLLTGADAYRRLSQRDQSGYEHRTASQYLTTRVRQADRLGGVRVDTFDGQDTLVLSEEIDGELYETLVYCHDGYLRELFAAAGGDFTLEDGEKVLKAHDLKLQNNGNILLAELTDFSGETQSLTLCLRSGKGASQ